MHHHVSYSRTPNTDEWQITGLAGDQGDKHGQSTVTNNLSESELSWKDVAAGAEVRQQ